MNLVVDADAAVAAAVAARFEPDPALAAAEAEVALSSVLQHHAADVADVLDHDLERCSAILLPRPFRVRLFLGPTSCLKRRLTLRLPTLAPWPQIRPVDADAAVAIAAVAQNPWPLVAADRDPLQLAWQVVAAVAADQNPWTWKHLAAAAVVDLVLDDRLVK